MSDVATLLSDPSLHYLATHELNVDKSGQGFQKFNIKFGKDMNDLARTIAVLIAVIWVLYAISKFAAPSSRAGGGSLLQRIGGAGPMIAAMIFIAMLLDLDGTTTVVNTFLKIGYSLYKLAASGLG